MNNLSLLAASHCSKASEQSSELTGDSTAISKHFSGA